MAHGRHIPTNWDDSWWTPQRLAVGELTPSRLAWLDALPATLHIELSGAAPALLVHGSPRGSREGMGRMFSDEQAAEALVGVTERTVIGAVGCPFNGDINAQYGLFAWDVETHDWRFEQRSVPYDHERIYAAWRESGYLDDGSLSAELMLLEHRTAHTQYVPFWDWCLARDLPLTRESHARFVAERG
jgi:hypothetical protein